MTSAPHVLAFAAGAVSSFGPCALPRCVAAAGFAGTSLRSSATKFLTLQAGLTTGYCALGLGSGFLAGVVRHSAVFYSVLAALLCFSGLYVLLRERTQCEGAAPHARLSIGGTFLMGASFAFVISPCCTPVVLAVAASSATPLYAASIMAAFAAGHGISMLAAMTGAQTLRLGVQAPAVLRARASFSGALLVALGTYYAVLA